MSGDKAEEYMIIHNGTVLRSHIRTFKAAIKEVREVSWLPGDVKLVKVIVDGKDI